MSRTRHVALLGMLVLAGCFDGDDDTCEYQYGAPQDPPSYQLRDPATGTCQDFGGWGVDCADPCTPCAAGAEEAQPDWAQCYTACESLGEAACKSTSGCRATYAGGTYHQCWATAPSGPIQGGDCGTFDAQTCSRHDDCVALHAAGSPIGAFASCAAESMLQDPGSCVGAVSCSDASPACPSGTLAGRRNGCWTGYCIPYPDCDELPACSTLDESDCISRSDCAPTYLGNNCTCTTSGCTCQSWTFDTCKMD